MARTGNFKCGRCGRTFSMKAHLARHLSAGHGGGKKSGARRAKKRRGRVGRPKGSVNRTTAGRRGRKAGRSMLGLRSMSFESLNDLIVAAKAEARRKLQEWQRALA